MGRLILAQNVSADGFIGSGDEDGMSWMSIDGELHSAFNRMAEEAAVGLCGRVTHEIMLSYWPTAEDDPGAAPEEREYSRIWKAMPKVVLSTTLPAEQDWNTTVISSDAAAEVRKLKESTDGDVLVGGGTRTPSFLAREGLIDETNLYVHPAALGGGEPLFSGLERPLRLEPVEARSFGSGVILLRHRVLND